MFKAGEPVSDQNRLPVTLEDASGLPTTVAPASIYDRLFEAFEAYSPNRVWTESKASGDIVVLDGNSLGASYLVISKDPLTAGSVTTLTSVDSFEMPFDVSVGAHMSQRTLGQEFAIEAVGDGSPVATFADLAISAISQTTTTLTVTTSQPHGLKIGMRVGISGCVDSRFNYPSLVVASTPSPTQFTTTGGPGGTLPSVTATPTASGVVYMRPAIGYASNGSSLLFENATATNGSFYIKTGGGDSHIAGGVVSANHSVALLTTASVLAVTAAYHYAFQPATEYRLAMFPDRVQWTDTAVDALTPPNLRVVRTQSVPDPDVPYRIRFRAVNNAGLTVPNAQIVSAVKTGTTTATVTTATPHGLSVTDVVNIYGTRDTTNFPALTVATAVASVVNATQFTIVWGGAVTATSYGGYVARVQGGNLMSALGALGQTVQAATLASGVLTLTGSAAWSGVAIGDLVNVVGCRNNVDGATMGVDGAWRVRNIVTTSLELEAVGSTVAPADFGATNCSGGVIRRTDLRISFVRLASFVRERVEALPRASTDEATAAPVRVQNTVPVTLASTTAAVAGNTAVDSPITNPVLAGGRASNANIAAMSATGDLVALLMTMIGAAIVKPFSLPEADWRYAGASGGIVDTTDVPVKTAAGAGIKNYMTALQYFNSSAVASEIVVKDGATVIWRGRAPANMVDIALVEFPSPLQSTANAALNVAMVTTGTATVVSCQGYSAP